MKKIKKQIISCIIGFLLLLLLLLAALFIDDKKVSFSAESGFYEEDFYLEIKASGTIYYTLDCSIPDENSMKYDRPILISDASSGDNMYSIIPDVYIGFDDNLKNGGFIVDSDYAIPDYLVDKAIVIRAISIDSNGKKSEVYTRVYFVGYNLKSGYDDVGIISIVTEPDNLFGYENGIYVTGKIFDDYVSSLPDMSTFDPWTTWNSANYHMTGEEWERKAEITFWNKDKNIIEQGSYGIRIQGAGSRAWLPKNINIFERKDKYQNSELDGLSLGFDNDINCVNLFGGSQDNLTLCKDWLVNDLTEELDFPHTKYMPYALFLDGEYWGMYLIKENMNPYYFKQKYGIEDVSIISDKGLEEGKKDDLYNYDEIIEFARENDLSIKENYDYIGSEIDLDSLIDYYAAEIYICNADWPSYNYAVFKPEVNGKFYYMLFDVNDAMYKDDYNLDTVSTTASHDILFAKLMENDEFKERFNERLVYLADNVFNPERVDAFIDAFETKMTLPMVNDYKRFWSDGYDEEAFYNNCESIRDFFKLRYEYVKEQYSGR